MKQHLIRHRALEATGANTSRRLLEADEQSLNERMDAVACAAREKFKGPADTYIWVPAVFDSYAIIAKGDELWRVSYAMNAAGECEFQDDAVAVVRKTTYQPEPAEAAEPAEMTEGLIFGPIADEPVAVKEGEAAQAPVMTGKKWGVVIIQEGMSKNRNRYQRKALQTAAPLYEGAKVYTDHKDRGTYGRSIMDQAGFLKGVAGALLGVRESFGADGKAQGTFALVGTLVVTKPAIRQEMLEAWEEGAQDFFGLSHDAMCDSVLTADTGGRAFYDVQRIESVQSVDLVSNAAAGGRVLRLVASDSVPVTLERDAAMLKKMMEAIQASGNAALKSKLEALGANPTEDQVMALFSQIGTAQPVTEAAAPAAATAAATPTNVRQVSESEWLGVRRDGISLFLENTVGGTSLPDMVKDSLRQKFTAVIEAAQKAEQLPARESITAEVASQVELFGKMAEANIVLPSAAGKTRVQSVESRREKIDHQLDAFFGVKKEGERFVVDPRPALMSFRNLYADITGDTRVTGRMSECTRLTENLTSATFDQVLADAINRRMVADYAMQNQAAWRGTIAEVVPAADFRTQHRVRFGGYGNLPTVTQGSPYAALTSPTDEEATYSVSKRGGTEQLTIEMIANDDVGAVRRIPQKLARSAAQTLYEFVFDFLATNATIYDSVALIASGHSNIVTTAMTTSNIAALRLKMKNQADMSNSKRIGLKARYLFVPNDLEELAFYLTQADRAVPDSSVTSTAAAAAPNFVRGQGIQPIVVDYWTDANDYHLTASVDQTPMIEVAFLGGREEPELFVQDTPNQGSLFTNDVITYKLRHIYGGGVLDYRGFAGGIVS